MWVAGCLKKSFLFSPIRNTAACNLHQIFLIPERSAWKLLLVGWMWGVHIAHARLLGGRVALGQACPSHHLLCLHSWSTDKPMQIPYEWKCLLEGKGLRLWPFPFCGSIVLEPFWRTKLWQSFLAGKAIRAPECTSPEGKEVWTVSRAHHHFQEELCSHTQVVEEARHQLGLTSPFWQACLEKDSWGNCGPLKKWMS